MKKTISLFAILTAAVTLNSCWIAPVYQDYESVGKACYFKDYDTMKAVTISKINKSFTEWHWSTKEFDSKLDKYMNNIDPNEEDLEYLKKNGYEWAVRNDTGKDDVCLKKELNAKTVKVVTSEYYWVTCSNGESVIFYKTDKTKIINND